jgi:hypothetical protein
VTEERQRRTRELVFVFIAIALLMVLLAVIPVVMAQQADLRRCREELERARLERFKPFVPSRVVPRREAPPAQRRSPDVPRDRTAPRGSTQAP